MYIDVEGDKAYASTGGHDHVAGQPAVVFIHGAGQSHLTWPLQVRSFAYDGFNVLAPDLPGHGLSKSAAIDDIPGQARWMLKLLDRANIERAHIVAHSQGGLVALELAGLVPERVASIVFVATAGSIAVNEALIGLSQSRQEKAIAAMLSWGFGPDAHHHENSLPGVSLIGAGTRLMEQNADDALPADLKSCAEYVDGLGRAAALACPTLCVFASKDKMTALKFGRKLAAALPNNHMHIIQGAGHMLPGERPREVNQLIRKFFAGLQASAP